MPSSHDPLKTDAPTRTALVLGGGGSAGNAWLIGILAGLTDGGLDVTDADLTIGTSAGATAAAQLTGARPATLYADILMSVVPARHTGGAAASGGQRPGGAGLAASHLDRMRATIAASDGIADFRRRMGRELDTDDAARITAQWRETVATRLPGARWPERRMLLTAVDAATGEPVLFDRDSGVSIADAVAASTAGGFAYGIGEHRYIDGGYRTNADNADLASGCERVLVLSPLGGRSFHPGEWGTHLSTQVDALRAQSSLVETVFPDAASLDAFGDNMMNPATRLPAARAGFAQGSVLAQELSGFWV